MPPSVEMRLGTADDAPACNDFHNSYYGTSRTLAQWHWEFGRGPTDNGTIPFVIALADGRVVGTQALIPIELVDSRGAYWSGKSEETLVAESMRGQHLFDRMYDVLLAEAQRRDIRFIWGFTPASHAFLRAGFVIPARTSQVFCCFTNDAAKQFRLASGSAGGHRSIDTLASSALSLYSAVRRGFKPRLRKGVVSCTGLSEPPSWADTISHDFVGEWGGTSLHRSKEYLDWRFFSNPFGRPAVVAAFVGDHPAGWVAFGMGEDRTASIVDLVAVSPNRGAVTVDDVIDALLREAMNQSRDMGAAGIRAWHVSNHPFASKLRRRLHAFGWVSLSRGFDMVVREIAADGDTRTPVPMNQFYVTRAFTEGSSF